MDFIQSSNKQVDKFGVGKHGFSAGNPTGGVLATYFTNLWADGVQQEIINAIEASGQTPSSGTLSQLLLALNLRGPVVAEARGVRALLAAAGASLTVTAAEIVLKSALGGIPFILPNFNKTINLATVGAGGMDVGAAPASGYVAIYAILNPVTGVSSLVATNATAAAAPHVYGGANMPAGYTASALLAVWPTTAGNLLIPGLQQDRQFTFGATLVLNSSVANQATTALSVSSVVPINAKTASGWATRSSSTATSGFFIAGDATNGLGSVQLAAGSTSGTCYTAGYFVIPLPTPQTVYWSVANSLSVTAYISGYSI